MTERRKSGRAPRDWDTLFNEWVLSGKTKSAFMESKGINSKSGSAITGTREWYRRLDDVRNKTFETRLARIKDTKETVSAEPIIDKAEVGKEIGIDFAGVKEEAQPSTWQVISRWRSKQAVDDWKTADSLRVQIKLMLQKAVKKKVRAGDNGETITEYETSLSAHELRAITTALESIQRIQRLALGLSTENVGVDFPEVAGKKIIEEQTLEERIVPIFQVRMNKGGRFVDSRPRRIT